MHRRMGRPWRVATVVTVALFAAGCSNDGSSGPDGSALYQEHCASCHGSDLRGTEQGPSHLSKVYEPSHHPDASFRIAITRGASAHHWGFGDMPPVPGLSDAEVTAIIEFIREQQGLHGFETYPPS